MSKGDYSKEVLALSEKSYFQGGNDVIDTIIDAIDGMEKLGAETLSMQDFKLLMIKTKESFNENREPVVLT